MLRLAPLAGLLLAAGAAAAGTELVMVEKEGCPWCLAWHAEVGPGYPLSDEGRRAPLRREDIDDIPDDLVLDARPVFTPTFILVHDGVELGRLEGYAGAEFFYPLIDRLLEAAPPEE